MSLRTRSISLIAAVWAAASLVPGSASGQAPDSSKGGIRIRAAVGMDAMLYDGPQRIPSLFGLAGLEWLHPRAPFSARLDLSYFRSDKTFDGAGCVDFCQYANRYEVLGVSLDGRYTFLARAPVRPYLFSGFGIYRPTNTLTANYTCADFTCTPTPGQRSTFRESSMGLGLHAGLGLALPIRRSELSLEFRLQQQTSGIRQGYTMPVALGIRF